MAGHPPSPPMLRHQALPAGIVEPPPSGLAMAPRSFTGILQRQWRLAASVATITFLTLAIGGTMLPKRYSAEAQITLSSLSRESGTGTAAAPTDTAGDEASMMTEMQVLQSRWLVRRTVEALRRQTDGGAGLEEDWGDPVAGGPIASIRQSLSAWLPGLTAPSASATPEFLLQNAVERVAEHLSVGREAGARIIRVQYWSHDAKRAAQLVNTLIAEYQRAQVDTKVAAARDLEQMLVGPLQELQDKARTSDEAVEAYRRASGFIDVNEGPLIARQIQALTELQAQARARRQDYEARVQTLDSGRNGDSIPEVLDSRLITELRQQQSQISQTATSLSSHFAENNPQVVEARSRLAEIQRRIDDENRRIAASLRREVAIQQQREAAIKSDMERQRQDFDKVNGAMVKMRELEREAQANRVLVTSFLERHKQMQVQGLVINPSLMVLSRALEPALPSFPRMPMVLTVCALLSVVAGAAVAVAREFRRAGLLSLEDLELTKSPAAGIIPAIAHRLGPPEDLLTSNPRSLYAESFRKLLTAVTRVGDIPPRRLLVTSSLPGEGKTTTVLSLARIAAHGGRRVVVIDCDLRNPCLHHCLAERSQVGLADILEGRAQLAEGIQRDRLDRMDVIPAGRARGELFDLLAGDAMSRLMTTLSQTYDLILLDSPPSAVVADTRVLASLVDAVLFCVQWGKTPVGLAQSEMNILLADGHTVGIVLSQVNMREFAPYGRYLCGLYPAYQQA